MLEIMQEGYNVLCFVLYCVAMKKRNIVDVENYGHLVDTCAIKWNVNREWMKRSTYVIDWIALQMIEEKAKQVFHVNSTK